MGVRYRSGEAMLKFKCTVEAKTREGVAEVLRSFVKEIDQLDRDIFVSSGGYDKDKNDNYGVKYEATLNQKSLQEISAGQVFPGGKPVEIPEMETSTIVSNPVKERPKCRWCSSETKPLNNNGVMGPGYAEWNYACTECGKIQ